MRIHFLVLSVRKNGGGSHQNAITFVRTLKDRGHDVTVHTLYSKGNEPPLGMNIITEGAEGTSFISLQRKCADVLQKAQDSCDVFFLYGGSLVWGAGLYKARGGTRPVAVYLDSHLDSMKEARRSFPLLYRLKHRVWEKIRGLRLASQIDRFFVASPYLKDRYVAHGFSARKFTVIPNAFQLSEARREGEDTESRGGVRLLSVSRISHEKGVDLLLKACRRLPASLEWRLKIVGDGDDFGKIQEIIKKLEFKNRIECTGWLDPSKLGAIYAATDILVVPSRVAEPFGRTIVEAMSMRIPVIVPQEGGAAWVAGEGGRTFSNGDVDSLANALSSLIADPDLRSLMGAKGKERSKSFDVNSVVPQIEAELVALLKK